LTLKLNKRGNAIADTLLVLVLIFIFIFATIYGKSLFNDFNADLQADPDISDEAKAISADHHGRYTGFFDALFALIFILLWALVIIASFKLDTHPIFFIFTIILLLFVFYIGAELANTYDDMIGTDPELNPISDEFTIADWIFNNYLLVMIAIGFSIVLVLFAKNRMSR